MEDISKAVKEPCPYGDLFIYYISGIVKDNAAEEAGESFIGNWVEDGFSFLFFNEPADDSVNKYLQNNPELELLDTFRMPYYDWIGGEPKSIEIGEFIVSPPWDKPDPFYLPNFGACHIILDPGVVFGTGTHPTTRDCLDLMAHAVRENSVERVLDLGTGTGLLALAAGKYRCRKILAVDFNYLAVKTTHRNIKLNGFEDRIAAVQGMAESFVDVDADLLIANIHYDVMKHIIASEGFLKKKQFILSGLLKSQASRVTETLSEMPVDFIERESPDGVWHTYYGKRV